MIRPVKQRYLDIYNRITGQNAGIQSLPYTFLNCRYIFPRDRPADNLIFKHKTFSGRLRLHRNPDVTVLTTPAGLPYIPTFTLNLAPYSLSVRNLRLAHIGINLEFSEHPVNNDLKMQLSHTGDYSLTCFLISLNPERRVFLSQLLQGHTHSFLICLCLGLYCNTYDRLRKLHLLEYYRIFLVTQGISGSGTLQTNCRRNITGIYSLDLFPLIGMHFKDTPYPLRDRKSTRLNSSHSQISYAVFCLKKNK